MVGLASRPSPAISPVLGHLCVSPGSLGVLRRLWLLAQGTGRKVGCAAPMAVSSPIRREPASHREEQYHSLVSQSCMYFAIHRGDAWITINGC